MAVQTKGYDVITLLHLRLCFLVVDCFDKDWRRVNHRRRYDWYIEGPAWCILVPVDCEKALKEGALLGRIWIRQ